MRDPNNRGGGVETSHFIDHIAGRRVVLSVSGGKDSAATSLYLRELGIDRSRDNNAMTVTDKHERTDVSNEIERHPVQGAGGRCDEWSEQQEKKMQVEQSPRERLLEADRRLMADIISRSRQRSEVRRALTLEQRHG